jgi:hypothetical protein
MRMLALVWLLLVQAALADPAPWYQWRSKVDGKVFCAQTSPGEGWERLAQAYRDARCERVVKVGAKIRG